MSPGMNGTANGGSPTNDVKTVGGLRVSIVGGGIAGMSAAIALRKQGHSVHIYEQSRFANESGAAIHSTPNATGLLRYLDIDPEDTGAVPLAESRISTHQDELLRSIDHAADAHRWQHPWMLAHRAHLHTRLKKVASGAPGSGSPVKLHTSSRVKAVDAESATLTLEDGSIQSADVLVGADGVHSITRQFITPNAPCPKPGRHNCFRFTISRESALKDINTERFARVNGVMHQWYAPDRKIVCYPTARNELLNFVCIHPEHLSHISNDYNQAASKSLLLEVFAGFHPDIKALLNKVPADKVRVYALYDMEALPTFKYQRLALIGDAAHPFTPHLAQGGAMAIEDGVSLGVMLDANVSRADVIERLELYNSARYDRATTIQGYSRLVGEDGTDDGKTGQRFNVLKYLEYGLSHDELHHSQQILRCHR